MTSLPPEIQSFEQELDKELADLPCLQYDGSAVLSLAANIIEQCHSSNRRDVAAHFKRGLDVLAPHLLDRESGALPEVKPVWQSLEFAGHYYAIRDYFYYSYNSEDSCEWSVDSNEVGVRFLDRSIPRQYWLKITNVIIDSVRLFADTNRTKAIEQAIASSDEFTISPDAQRIWDLIFAEVDEKLSTYFAPIPPDSTVSLGDYSYAQFYTVYRLLVAKALYHRYHSRVNASFGAIQIGRKEFLEATLEETGFCDTVVDAILSDLTYNKESRQYGVHPMHCALFTLADDTLLLIPSRVCVQDGLVNILRVVAQRDSGHYQSHVAGAVNSGFGRLVATMFADAGFACHEELDLSRYRDDFPDIDLLAVSEELTLGYFCYVCELKGVLPAQWSKDYVRFLDSASLPKAFRQLRRVSEFLSSQEGRRYLRRLLPSEGIPHFGSQFVVAAHLLVITSDNAGMFFGGEDQTIIDYRTLARLLRASDGDVTYINHFLRHLDEILDSAVETQTISFRLGKRRIAYEAVTTGRLFDFARHDYKSVGLDLRIAADFIRGGHHPFDVLGERTEDE